MKKLIIILTFVMVAIIAFSQVLPSARKRAVYGRDFYISASHYDYSSVAKNITAGDKTRYEKARHLYMWICDNIEYDASNSVHTADECWDKRRGVCQAICELYYRLAETVGLKSRVVFGLSKHAGRQITYVEHSWMEVDTDRGQILIDPTWGAGFHVGNQVMHQFDPMIWFDVDPSWMIFTHMPEYKTHQHLASPITMEQFKALPYMTPLSDIFGVASAEVLSDALEGRDTLPIVEMNSGSFLEKLDIIEMPTMRYLQVGTPYTFRIRKKDADMKLCLEGENVMLKENEWTEENGVYSITIRPEQTGELRLVVERLKNFIPLRKSIITYEVE